MKYPDYDKKILSVVCRNPVDTEYQIMSERPLQLLNMKNTGYKRIPTVELEFSNDNTYLIAKSMTNHLVWIYFNSKEGLFTLTEIK